MKLIKADPIANGIAEYLATNAYLNDTAQDALEMVGKWLNDAPAVDATPVVRCKDCIYYHKKIGYGFGQCSRTTLMPYPDDFCSYGEKKKEGA